MTLKKQVALAGLSALALALTAGPASADSDAAKQFKREFQAKVNSWERIDLIRGLDPSDEDSLELLTEFVLKQLEWYYREAAIDVLAGVYDPEIVEELEDEAGRRGDPVIAEGIITAFGRSGNTDRVPFIIEALEHKKWKVQRAAAIALGSLPDKRSIDPLIDAWEEEEDTFMVWVHILETLETITRETNMPRHEDWRSWWDTVKDTWELPTEDEIEDEEAKSGEVIRTRVRGTDLEFRSRGNGMPLLVLPEYGYEKDYLETYLRNLEEENQILYMKLPGAADFVDPPLQNAPGLPSPYYPLERIVETFEALHTELVEQEKIEDKPFAIMAHGLTCWVAMKYAAKHPRRVRRMILVAPTSGDKAWSDGRERVERLGQQQGDIEMEHYAQTQLFENGQPRYSPSSPDEEEALQRKGHTLYFFDYRDLEIGRIYGPIVEKRVGDRGIARVHECFRPMGSVFIPEFSLFREQRSPTPTLILTGERSTRISLDDCRAIAKHYQPAARVITFDRSSRMPFIEQNEKFVEVVSRFLGGGR